MAAVQQARERQSGNKKTFGWISRLYKRSSHQDPDVEGGSYLLEQSVSRATTSSNRFLNLGPSAGDVYNSNEISSIRPTLSTRAPSFAQSEISNNAVYNHEAIASPVLGQASTSESGTRIDGAHEEESPPPVVATSSSDQRDTVQPSDDMEHRSQTSARELTSPLITELENCASSLRSSTASPIPSIFTNKTVDTQPTLVNNAPTTSLLSARTTGLEATDNASMLTLASSSNGNRRRRNSTDTNCSVRALAPASARASFESARTGLTDTRRIGIPNSGTLAAMDEIENSIATLDSRTTSAGLGRRSVSAISLVSDTLSIHGSHSEDRHVHT